MLTCCPLVSWVLTKPRCSGAWVRDVVPLLLCAIVARLWWETIIGLLVCVVHGALPDSLMRMWWCFGRAESFAPDQEELEVSVLDPLSLAAPYCRIGSG